MFESFFRSFSTKIKWSLRPKKYPSNSNLHFSSKVLLPYSIFQELILENVQLPYLFEISHANCAFKTKCSVNDFTANEGEIVVPSWIYEQISLDNSCEAIIEPIKLEKGEGLRLQPHSIDFLELENPKEEFEKCLREYAVLTLYDEIILNFDDIGICRFTVTDIKPDDMISIYLVDSDIAVEFDQPVGYEEKLEAEKSILPKIKINHNDKPLKTMEADGFGVFLDWNTLDNQ